MEFWILIGQNPGNVARAWLGSTNQRSNLLSVAEMSLRKIRFIALFFWNQNYSELKIFWTQNYFELKIFLTQNVF